MAMRGPLAEAYEHLMSGTGRCSADDLAQWVSHQYPDIVLDNVRRLAYKQLRREAREFMKEQRPVSEEDVTSQNQLGLPLGILPGMRPPRTLVVQLPTGAYEHVRYDVARWTDLESALEEKTLNIERAIARREDHQRKMDALAPHMRLTPARTVGEACEIMQKGL